jgi:hypothetical protein
MLHYPILRFNSVFIFKDALLQAEPGSNYKGIS